GLFGGNVTVSVGCRALLQFNDSICFLSPFNRLQVNLRLILVSGKTQDFIFSPNDSATEIARHVFENWPAGWEEESVSSPSILRLIFQGRFLHGNVTLGALKLPPGRTTVMHLVARETLPEPNSHVRIYHPYPLPCSSNVRQERQSPGAKNKETIRKPRSGSKG
uniref:Ubiquitin-like protein 3 n=1 Tax=Cyprinus carpio TaxID=7962 RepID=A0A8C1MMC2_CYPCA